MATKQRIFGYDLLKALTMIGIVFYHLHCIHFDGIPTDGSTYMPGVGKVLYGLLSAGVPMFYMVNGAIVSNKVLPFRKCLHPAIRLTAISIFWTITVLWFIGPWIFNVSRVTSWAALWEYYWSFYTFSAVYLITWVLNRIRWLHYIVVSCLVIFPFLTN